MRRYHRLWYVNFLHSRAPRKCPATQVFWPTAGAQACAPLRPPGLRPSCSNARERPHARPHLDQARPCVFDVPRRARAFFEATVADNLDIGRPDEVKLIFSRRIRSDTKGEFATKVVTRGTEVTVNAFYKHSRIKQYLKEGRALRIETVVNSPTDLGVQRRLHNLAELVEKAKGANRRLLELQRAGQGCAIETALWERISQPSREEGQRTGALRFGDQRAMALAGALCVALNTVVGFTNKSLRALVSQLLDGPYSTSQMTYDLRRLRLKGLVIRLPHTNRYTLSEPGIRFAVTYTKLGRRVLPRYSRPINPRPPPSSVKPSGSSTTTSRTISNMHVSSSLPENLPQM